MNTIDRTKLLTALQDRYPGMSREWCVRSADWILGKMDARLLEAVRDFSEGRELTDTRYEGPDGKLYGVVQIMRQRSNDDIVGALRLMNKFFADPDAAICAIDRTFC